MLQDDEELIQAVKVNNPMIVSEWLQHLALEDTDAKHKLAQVLKQAAQCLSVDVVTLFQPPSKKMF